MRPSNARYRAHGLLWLVLLPSGMHLSVHAQTSEIVTLGNSVIALNGSWQFHLAIT